MLTDITPENKKDCLVIFLGLWSTRATFFFCFFQNTHKFPCYAWCTNIFCIWSGKERESGELFRTQPPPPQRKQLHWWAPAQPAPCSCRNSWISAAPDGFWLSSVSGSNLNNFPAELQNRVINLCSCVQRQGNQSIINSTLIQTPWITVQSRLRLDSPTSATRNRSEKQRKGSVVQKAGKETDCWPVGA